MRKNKGVDILTWAFALLPLVLTAVFYAKLPEKIVMQWGFDGAMRYDPKWELWIVAALSPFLLVMFRVMPKIDPKKQNYAKFGGAYQTMQLATMLLLCVMVGVTILEAFFPGTVNVSVLVTVLVGILFILLGNVMPQFRHNYFCGIKTPWTLASESVWAKANRLGGRLLFGGGMLIVLSILLAEKLRFTVMMVLVAVIAIVPCVMSYIWFKREQADGE